MKSARRLERITELHRKVHRLEEVLRCSRSRIEEMVAASNEKTKTLKELEELENNG